MFKIEAKPIVHTRLVGSKSSPVTDALTEALTALKPGQSFVVTKKGQLSTAMRLAKDLGIERITTSTANGELRVGMKTRVDE